MSFHNSMNIKIDQPTKQYNSLPNTEYGLNYGTWRPDTLENNNIIVNEKLNSNWKYRRFLQNNATIILPLNNEIDLEDKLNNVSYPKNKFIRNPILYNGCLDEKHASISRLPFSDLKKQYLKSYEENCRMFCPKLTI